MFTTDQGLELGRVKLPSASLSSWASWFTDPHEKFTSEQFREKRKGIAAKRELALGDDVTGARAFAYQGAVALYTALGAPAGLGAGVLRDCSSTLRNSSFRLERRCNARLLDEEDDIQRRDIADLSTVAGSGDVQRTELRERSAVVGRKWLDLAVERFG
ncbi:hypothetical protein E5082_15105 [Streptomyces griseoluteus]|uniref:Uncharacterized protein n=1 Tax=Streptomyces griseoluteus TaxID=29306 RepID=A0A4Z1DHW0_STRGP|nr:hypothetical protein [Streptomyces griseoluteus]TGN82936.1 hypothetical protein E5082_15105 [Streptomyces griseoluteus]GHF16534.1 hypothetical protein GCM10017776_37770 [Streptomyces griseoluteus]